MSGAQYLHDPIPGLTPDEADDTLCYLKVGSKEGYAEKVYGSTDAPCSWEVFPEGYVKAWSMQKLYQRLWERYENRIKDMPLTANSFNKYKGLFDLVVCSAPRSALCLQKGQHKFAGAQTFIYPLAAREIPENTIVYNGNPGADWYRTSRIFGEESTEATRRIAGFGVEAWIGTKPTTTDCDCHPDVFRVGRFGKWEKKVLVHDAYQDTLNYLDTAERLFDEVHAM